jgi:hypothetical protein
MADNARWAATWLLCRANGLEHAGVGIASVRLARGAFAVAEGTVGRSEAVNSSSSNRHERARCRLGSASRDNASSPPAGWGRGVAGCRTPVFHDPLGSRLREGTRRERSSVGTGKCNIRARVELGDAVKPDLCCRLMTGHDLIGRRRHSRVSTATSERSRAENLHEHTDARSALERGGDFAFLEEQEKGGRTGKSHVPSVMSFGRRGAPCPGRLPAPQRHQTAGDFGHFGHFVDGDLFVCKGQAFARRMRLGPSWHVALRIMTCSLRWEELLVGQRILTSEVQRGTS